VFDIHNHVLPGVDDGAGNLNIALRMLEAAARQGITHVACTPHLNDRANEETDRLLQSVFAQLKEAAGAAQIPVDLALASEIMLGADVLRVLSLPVATYRGAGKYCLLEFPFETPFEIILNAVKSIQRHSVWSVLAHFERFSRAQRTPDQPRALQAAGAIISLDAGSLTGRFGPPMVKGARQLLEWQCVDILASDAHDDAMHGFCLKAGADAAAHVVGSATVQKLVVENPRCVWEGLPWPERASARKDKVE
jgi:protein-tyrosine phosphatase